MEKEEKEKFWIDYKPDTKDHKYIIPVRNKEDLLGLPTVNYKIGDQEYRVIDTRAVETEKIEETLMKQRVVSVPKEVENLESLTCEKIEEFLDIGIESDFVGADLRGFYLA